MFGLKELPERKAIRLKDYDYSQKGCYFITMCVKGRHEMLGKVVVGRGFPDAPYVEMSEYGICLQNSIDFVRRNNDNIKIDNYIIMPNHAHLLVTICHSVNGASGKPRPTNAIIPKLISSIKRFTNREIGFDIWQTSYHDHIVRNEEEYRHIRTYIDENPARWEEDSYFT